MSPARFANTREIPTRSGVVIEAVVRLDELEARALTRKGQPIESWTVARVVGRRWERKGVTLTAMRASRQKLPAIAKLCARLERAAA